MAYDRYDRYERVTLQVATRIVLASVPVVSVCVISAAVLVFGSFVYRQTRRCVCVCLRGCVCVS